MEVIMESQGGLQEEQCQPCKGIGQPLGPEAIQALTAAVAGWTVQEKELERTVVCKDFPAALAFVNQVGAIAEAEDHHPDIFIHRYKRVRLTLSTHALGGLTRNDFIVAAKINALMPSAA